MMNILSVVESYPHAVANEALNYSMLALTQAGVPEPFKMPDFYRFTSAKPTPQGLALSRKILSQIEEAEQADIDHLDQQALGGYMREVSSAVDELHARMSTSSPERIEAILEEMRAGWQ